MPEIVWMGIVAGIVAVLAIGTIIIELWRGKKGNLNDSYKNQSAPCYHAFSSYSPFDGTKGICSKCKRFI